MPPRSNRPRTSFTRAVSYMIDDIRHRLIEEGWFGRKTTPEHQIVHGEDRGLSERMGWGRTSDQEPTPSDARSSANRLGWTQEPNALHAAERRDEAPSEKPTAKGWGLDRSAGEIAAMREDHNRDLEQDIEQDQ